MSNNRKCGDCEYVSFEISEKPCFGCYMTQHKPNFTPKNDHKMDQKYRYLKVGDVTPKGYEFRSREWSEGDSELFGYELDQNDIDSYDYRVPITEPEKEQSVCEMVLSENVQCFEKVCDKCIRVTFFDGSRVFSGNMVGTKPSNFHEATIGTIWDNVDGKPVRRKVVEKCAVCGCEPKYEQMTGEYFYSCKSPCLNHGFFSLNDWNNRQNQIIETLQKAGWVRK